MFRLCGDVTITGKEQHILTYTQHSWPLSSEQDSDTPMVWIKRALIFWQEIIKVIALDTKGLRENPMSSIIRQIRITASNFREVLSAKRGNLFVLIPVYAY